MNWEDDSTVEEFTLRSDNARHGAARLPTKEAKAASCVGEDSPISCERAPLKKNRFHGNLVFKGGLSRILAKQLAASVAMKSSLVPPRSTALDDGETE